MPPAHGWYRWDGPDLILQVLVQPRAACAALGPVAVDRLKVRLTAPPVEGRANEALAVLLAAEFGVPKSGITVEQGETGRRKRVRVRCPRKLPPELGVLTPTR